MTDLEMAKAALPRLMSKVERLPWSGCWVWMGSVGNSRYGKIRLSDGPERSTHRVSYLAYVGRIPKGVCVLHKCDIRECVNPAHLFLGTKSDNTKDSVKKGRHFSAPRLRTKCPKGHDYSGINANGARICKICMGASNLKFRMKRSPK